MIQYHLVEDAVSLQKNYEQNDSKLVAVQKNLVDEVWSDRPARRLNPVIHLDEKYSGKKNSGPPILIFTIILFSCKGQSSAEKVANVREEMRKKKAKAVIVTMLDEVAWLFNLRGSDIEYNPGA